MVATMVVENGQSVVCKLIPQMQRQLGLAVLGFRRPWLVRGSSVVEIGLCTLDLYWDPLARVGGHLCVMRGSADMLLALHAAKRDLTLCAYIAFFDLRVCVLEKSVLPPAPMRSYMCWKPAFCCMNHNLLIHLKKRWPHKNNLPMKIEIQRPSQLSIPINMSPLIQLTSPNV